jgi:uncharacterized protein YfaA (DUF2138 family)
MWGPREVQHLVRMCLERVQWFPQPFDVVQQDCLVRIYLSAIPVGPRLRKRTLSALPVIRRDSTPGLKATANIS